MPFTRDSQLAFLTLGAVAAAILVGSPLAGWFPVVRLSAVLVPLVVVPVLLLRPWRWDAATWEQAGRWTPSNRLLVVLLGGCAALLLWIVYSRFQAGGINGVDFTIYFDRPLFQTSRGRPFFVESTDDPRFDDLTHLAVHAYWILLPFAIPYAIHATPLWLLGLSVVAVVAGAWHVFRIVRRLGGPGLLATAAALVVLFNDNTARALNYGFHAELLYMWFVPWAIDAALAGSRASFLAAVLCTVLVKEDAVFPLFAMSAALALVRGRQLSGRDRVLFLVVPTALALANLALYYRFVVPALSPGGEVMYSYFWSSRGDTPWAAAMSIAADPLAVAAGVLESGFVDDVLPAFLFLPIAGWRWTIGVLPLVAVYAVSDNDQLRRFGIYYAVPLVPFLTVASAAGIQTLARRVGSGSVFHLTAAVLLVAGAPAVGLGYSIRPWKPEIADVRETIPALADEQLVLVQSGLYPHAGYSANVQLLAPHSLVDATWVGAALVLARDVGAFPFSTDQWECLARLPPVDGELPPRLRIVRLTTAAAGCVGVRRGAEVDTPAAQRPPPGPDRDERNDLGAAIAFVQNVPGAGRVLEARD